MSDAALRKSNRQPPARPLRCLRMISPLSLQIRLVFVSEG
jgi:hypothetical protein